MIQEVKKTRLILNHGGKGQKNKGDFVVTVPFMSFSLS
jgi:hypothetical protein